MKKQIVNNQNRGYLIYLLIIPIILLLNIQIFKSTVYFLSDVIFFPVFNAGSSASTAMTNFFTSITKVNGLTKENKSLKEEIALLKEKEEGITLIYDKYSSMLTQQGYSSTDEYSQAELFEIDKTVFVNKGSSDGVKNGSSVILRNTYIGEIKDVGNKYSSVLLPNHVGFSKEVIIIPNLDISNISVNKIEKYIPKKIVRGIAHGNGGNIVLENVASSSSISNGYTVLINDSNSGDYFVLGKVSNIKIDKASPVLEANIISSFPYTDIMLVYIQK